MPSTFQKGAWKFEIEYSLKPAGECRACCVASQLQLLIQRRKKIAPLLCNYILNLRQGLYSDLGVKRAHEAVISPTPFFGNLGPEECLTWLVQGKDYMSKFKIGSKDTIKHVLTLRSSSSPWLSK